MLGEFEICVSYFFCRHSRDFVTGIISAWPHLSSACDAAGTSAGAVSTDAGADGGAGTRCRDELVSLLSLVFLVDCDSLLTQQCNQSTTDTKQCDQSTTDTTILGFWLQQLGSGRTTFNQKFEVLKLLPFFCAMTQPIQERVALALDMFKVHHLPLR